MGLGIVPPPFGHASSLLACSGIPCVSVPFWHASGTRASPGRRRATSRDRARFGALRHAPRARPRATALRRARAGSAVSASPALRGNGKAVRRSPSLMGRFLFSGGREGSSSWRSSPLANRSHVMPARRTAQNPKGEPGGPPPPAFALSATVQGQPATVQLRPGVRPPPSAHPGVTRDGRR